jgi:hypothetical protein
VSTAPESPVATLASWVRASKPGYGSLKMGPYTVARDGRTATCATTGWALIAYHGEHDAPAAPETFADRLAHLALADSPYPAPAVPIGDFLTWLHRAPGGDATVRPGYVVGAPVNLRIVDLALAAVPPCPMIRIWRGAWESQSGPSAIVVIDGDGWRVVISEFRPATEHWTSVPHWI